MLTVDRTPPAWFALAVCAGSTVDQLADFFPARWDSAAGARARSMCAGCPAIVACLEHAIAVGEPVGIHGGTNHRQRQRLRPTWAARAHDYDPACSDKKCRWCRAVDQVITHLDAKRVRDEQGRFAVGQRVNLNGPGARHGYRSTRARGCHCAACTFSVSTLGKRLTAAGWDTGEWWRTWARATGGEKAVMLDRARRIAAADLEALAVAA